MPRENSSPTGAAVVRRLNPEVTSAMSTATTATTAPADTPLARSLALGVAGPVAFGLAAAVGHGPAAMLRGAWMAPCLFAGAALLATPPLYLASVWSASRASAERVVGDVAGALGDAGVVLLGLAAPAAYFSATLRTPTARALLVGCVVLVGAVAVRSVARRTFASAPRGAASGSLWTLLAFALGLRMLVALSHHLPPAAW